MSADLDTQVIGFVQQVLRAMGLDLSIDVEETPDNIRLNLSGDGADVLLRRKGEALDALQVIVNTAFRRDARGDRHYVVDALGFRRSKDVELRQMAQFLIEKAKTSGLPQEIGPLNPYARRIVHLVKHQAVPFRTMGCAAPPRSPRAKLQQSRALAKRDLPQVRGAPPIAERFGNGHRSAMAELIIRRGLEEPDTSGAFVPHKPARPDKVDGGKRLTIVSGLSSSLGSFSAIGSSLVSRRLSPRRIFSAR